MIEISQNSQRSRSDLFSATASELNLIRLFCKAFCGWKKNSLILMEFFFHCI